MEKRHSPRNQGRIAAPDLGAPSPADGQSSTASFDGFPSLRGESDLERALRDSEQRLHLALEAGRMGTWEWEIASNSVTWSPGLEAIHGLAAGTFPGTFEAFQRDIHPDDLPRVLDSINLALHGDEDHRTEYRIVLPDGTTRWVEGRGRLLRDQSGDPQRMIGICADITDRKQAEEELREKQHAYELVVAGAEAAVWDWDVPAGRVRFSPRWKELRGLSNEELSDRVEEWSERIHPDDYERVTAAVRAHFEGRTPVFAEEYRIRHKDGHWLWILDRGLAGRDAKGRIVRMAGSETDITARKQAEQALRESEERFRMLADNMAQLAWTCDKLGESTWYNKRWLEYTGLSFEEMKGDGWKKVQHPDHLERVVKGVAVARERGEIWEDTFPLRGKDGQYRWFLSRAIPIRDESGEIIHWFGTNTDITQQRQYEEQMRVMMAELNHRVKNTLAVVQAMAAQTARRSADLKSFARRFSERLQSIAKAHSLLTNTEWEGCLLGEIVQSELDSRLSSPEQGSVGGPPIVLPPNQSLAMHLVIHELATNAMKYGALQDERGRIEVFWEETRRKRAPWLRLHWREHCGRRIEPPAETGYGSQLIEQSLEYDLAGEVELRFEAEGLICELAFPLSHEGSRTASSFT